MKRENCKPGTEVFIPGTVLSNDNYPSTPIEVVLQRGPDACTMYFSPDVLKLKDLFPKRKFYKKDKVRYMPSGRECYIVPPKTDKIYEVVSNEDSDGWIYIKGPDFNNCVKWFDLELIEPAESFEDVSSFSVLKYEDVYFCVGREGRYVYEIWFGPRVDSPLTEEDARQKAQELCDELNRKYNKKLNN